MNANAPFKCVYTQNLGMETYWLLTLVTKRESKSHASYKVERYMAASFSILLPQCCSTLYHMTICSNRIFSIYKYLKSHILFYLLTSPFSSLSLSLTLSTHLQWYINNHTQNTFVVNDLSPCVHFSIRRPLDDLATRRLQHVGCCCRHQYDSGRMLVYTVAH